MNFNPVWDGNLGALPSAERQKGARDVSEYCGYCKCDPCRCDGHSGPVGNHGKCGYCGDYIMDEDEQHPYGCSCDGFGGDPLTHEKPCRWCGGTAIGHWCDECHSAQ